MDIFNEPIVDNDEINACPKAKHHGNFITHKVRKRRRYLPGKFKNISLMYELVDKIVSLTGLLVLTEKIGDVPVIDGIGTGFITKIRRHTNICSNLQGGAERECAIVTVTTVLHVFEEDMAPSNESESSSEDDDRSNSGMSSVKSLDGSAISPTWNPENLEFKLDYIKDHKKVKSCPTLSGYAMVENDKDDAFKNDWCAVEFITYDTKLIRKLERALRMYHTRLEQLYQMSLLEDFKNEKLVIIVGHPHKMSMRVIIGRVVKSTTLKEVRNHQRWCRYTYQALTCPGLSGAPVYIFGQPLSGFGYWFGHPHNHASGFKKKNVFYGRSSIGVENL